MRFSYWWSASLYGGLIALGVGSLSGCSDNTEPLVPSAVTTISGDAQSLILGQSTSSPLVVRVTDQYGSPMSDVGVTWNITEGAGELSAASNVTDSNGQAQVSYTTGSTAGPVVISATVSGLEVVTFALTVLEAPPAT